MSRPARWRCQIAISNALADGTVEVTTPDGQLLVSRAPLPPSGAAQA